MKTAGKIFVILSMVAFVFSFVILLIYSIVLRGATTQIIEEAAKEAGTTVEQAKIAIEVMATTLMIVSFSSLVPFVVGLITLIVVGKAQVKSQTTVVAILTLLLCSLLGGIFLLVADEKDYPGYKPANN